MVHLGGNGACVEVISLALGSIPSVEGRPVGVDKTLLTVASVLYDAVYIPGGKDSVTTLLDVPGIVDFVQQAYRHGKAIGASNEGTQLLAAAGLSASTKERSSSNAQQGVVTARGKDLESFFAAFADAIADHRHFERGNPTKGAQSAPSRSSTKGRK